jgi:hypothetical protein
MNSLFFNYTVVNKYLKITIDKNFIERKELINADQDFYENIKKRKKTRMYLFCNLKNN